MANDSRAVMRRFPALKDTLAGIYADHPVLEAKGLTPALIQYMQHVMEKHYAAPGAWTQMDAKRFQTFSDELVQKLSVHIGDKEQRDVLHILYASVYARASEDLQATTQRGKRVETACRAHWPTWDRMRDDHKRKWRTKMEAALTAVSSLYS